MTHVAEEGNRRKGDMTNAEMKQSVLDVQVLEKALDANVPEELRALMSIQDGQIWFSEQQAMACKAIVAETLEMEGRTPGWRPGLIPFAKDVEGNFLVADAHERGCPVNEWDADGEGSVVSRTFSMFLERFRDRLLSGRCEFVEGIGVVEKMDSSSRRGK